MTSAQLQSLITGGNITRWTRLDLALGQAANQTYHAAVLLGCDGRYWVPATPRIANRLIEAGYEAVV